MKAKIREARLKKGYLVKGVFTIGKTDWTILQLGPKRLDTGLIVSDAYSHKCCKTAGIKSKSKHYKYKKPGPPYKVYPNLLLSELNVTGPIQCIVSDMTAFYVKGIYYELTIYMDLWNNEIISHSLSSKRGDRMTYISGLQNVIELKKNIRSSRQFFIQIRAPYIHLKLSTNYYRLTTSSDLCPEGYTYRQWSNGINQ